MSGFQELDGRSMVVPFIYFSLSLKYLTKIYILFNSNRKLLNYKGLNRYLYEIKQAKTKEQASRNSKYVPR